MEKLKIFSTFSGIGAFEKALDRIGAKYDLEGYCEIDKYASKAYALIHNTEEWMNYGDITKIDESLIPKDLDLFTYGFPCQDISLAGNQKGLVDEHGNKTRSGLVWDATRIIKASQPKIAIAENVKNLVSKKFKKEFEAILAELEEAGYNNYWKVLNAKEHGIAQNRERVFIVSIRKDIDLGLFKWPEKEELKSRLLDYLEDEVDEKYYLSDKMTTYMTDMTDRNGFVRGEKFNPHTLDSEYAYAITTSAGNRPTDNFIIMPENTKKGYALAEEGDGVYIDRPHQKRGVVQKEMIQTIKTSGSDVGVVVRAGAIRNRPDGNGVNKPNLELRKDDVTNALTTFDKDNVVAINHPPLRIRKLTPKECFRLMGFDDEDHDKVERAGISNAQRYKMAGNSIVVNVVEKILKNIIDYVL